MIRKYNIDASILYGNIERFKDVPFGNLTLELLEVRKLLSNNELFEGQGPGNRGDAISMDNIMTLNVIVIAADFFTNNPG